MVNNRYYICPINITGVKELRLKMSTSGMYIKRYFFKVTQTIFPGFDEYNVINYQVF